MKHLPSLLLLAVALLATAPSLSSPRKRPAALPLPSTIEVIERVNDHWQQEHSPLVRSFWDEAAYHTGNMEAYRLLGHARWLDYSIRWANHNQWQGAREKDPARWKYREYGEGQDYVLFGDWQICFQTYLDLYALTPDPYKVARAVEVMDYEVRQPQCDFWWWADALYMVMPVMTKLYQATGEVKYLDKLYDNYRWADSLMYDPEAHLYFRDAKYIYPKARTRNGGKDFWARGDGWVLAALAKVLADLPADYRHRPFFEQRFREVAQAVAQCQQPEGYWTRSMLDPTHAEGPETSGTAFFCYGLLWGVNNGLLAQADYAPVIDRAWRYLTLRALQSSGAVGFVQPIGERAIPGQQLSERNEANFGVGAFLLAACEHLRYEANATAAPAVGDGAAAALSFTVANPTDDYRNEVVSLLTAPVVARLGLPVARLLRVRNAAGLEVPYQLTHDGQLLVEASVRPHGEARFTIERGTPRTFPLRCYGRQYPERKDDFGWENDRGAYRVYGPALQRSGERSFGTDVWSKNSPQGVLDDRFWREDVWNMPRVQALHQQGLHRQADSLYRSESYHYDHGDGLDLYRVGPTLGCGAPALLNADGTLRFPYCYADYELLDVGPLRFAVHLTYNKEAFQGDSITEHRLVQLDLQSNFCQQTVWYEGLTQPVTFASGFVIQPEDTVSVVLGRDYVQYADPTDNAPRNNSQLFVAALFPDGGVTTIRRQSHALGLLPDYYGEPYTYYFGSAWSKYDCRSLQEWQQRIDWFLRSLRQPLVVTLQDPTDAD